jgi:hypothetical protein
LHAKTMWPLKQDCAITKMGYIQEWAAINSNKETGVSNTKRKRRTLSCHQRQWAPAVDCPTQLCPDVVMMRRAPASSLWSHETSLTLHCT